MALKQLLNKLDIVYESYSTNNQLRQDTPFLKEWFPDTIKMLEKWNASINKIVIEPNKVSDVDFHHCLGEMQSIGQGFDVDLSWSKHDEEIRLELVTCMKLSNKILIDI
tara:strand:- start:434 stop:760 length:327 start_codon:yes stop_codon:yes gene_type:complete